MTKDDDVPTGWFFWVCLGLGWAVIAFGFWTLFHNSGPDNPKYTLKLAFGFNILHDVLIAPLVCIAGYLIVRLVHKRMRPQVAWGLFASAIVLAIGYIPLRGLGRRPDNASVQPLDYNTAVLTVLGVVWVIVALLIVLAFARDWRKASRSKRSNHRSKAPSSK